MSRLLRRSSRRYLQRHPGQIALSVVGVALGVAVVVAIDLSVQSARAAFRASTEAVAGRATHRIVAGPEGLPDELVARVRLEAGVEAAAPVVEGWVVAREPRGTALRVLGVDPFSERPLRPWLAGGAGSAAGFEVAPLVANPGAAALADALAEAAGIEPGDTLRVLVGGMERPIPIVGRLTGGDGPARLGLREVVVMDVAGAQTLLGRVGRLDRVDLALPDGPAGDTALGRVRALVPVGARLEAAGARTETLAGMIRAFDLNLTALSLLALIFGMFLIYNALTFSVVQRRGLIGIVRALGVTRTEVVRLILGEAVVVGVVGSALGLLLGVALGRGLVRLVTRTINDLWFVVSVQGLELPPGALVKGALLGVGATLLAAVPPAREAASAPPRAALTRSDVEARWRRLVPVAAWAGLALAGAGAGLLALPTRDVLVAFGGLFGIVIGIALLTPLATVVAVRAALPLVGRTVGILGTMAARGVVQALSRTAPAVASLVVAVSVTVGLGVMISSFRGTVARWLDQTLQADVYVSPPSTVSSRTEGVIPPEVVARLFSVPGPVGRSVYRSALVPADDGDVRVTALELDPRGEGAFDFREGGGEAAFEAFRTGGAVLVSEPFAWRRRVGVGDTVRLPTPGGGRGYPVVGVYHDYGSDRGVVTMSWRTWARDREDPGVGSLGFFLDDGDDAEALADALRRAAGPGVALSVRSNRELRRGSLAVFDRTFAITGVLRAIALLVAFIGVLGALMALQLERARELGVLRANGLTPGQVWTLVTSQTGLMGAVAGVLAIPAGLALAVVMIFVVNRRSFGWTLRMEVGPEILLQAVGLALAGALLAGLYPAWRMSRTPPALALRQE